MNDEDFSSDPGSWDLGIDWNAIGGTYDGGTLDPFVVTEPNTIDDSLIGDWTGDTYFGGYNDWDYWNSWGITDPLADVYDLYIPGGTPTGTTAPTTTTTPPTTTTTRPPTTSTSGTAPMGSTSSTSKPPTTSGSTAQDLSKLLASILAAFKPPATTTPTGAPAPLASGFDFSSLALIGGGAFVAYLVLRKK